MAAALATRNGLRNGSTKNVGDQAKPIGHAAEKERGGERVDGVVPPACNKRSVGAGWSVNPIPSNPASSAATQKRVQGGLRQEFGSCGCATNGYVTRNSWRDPSAPDRAGGPWPDGSIGVLGEVRVRAIQRFAVDLDVGLLVVEGDQSSDGQQLAGREVVGPREVGIVRSPKRTDQ